MFNNRFQQSNVSAAVMVVSLVVVSLLGYIFLLNKTSGLKNQLIEKHKSVADRVAKEKYLLSLKSSMVSNKDDLVKLSSHFVTTDSVANFLGGVESMGRNLGLNITTVTLGIDKGTLGVEVSLGGSFADIYRFLLLMEKYPNHVDIEKTYLSYSAGAKPGPWSADIVLRVITFEQ